jgi:hypothetical protein
MILATGVYAAVHESARGTERRFVSAQITAGIEGAADLK